MNILLIEPDVVLADIYSRYLKQQSYKIVVATTAQQAIQFADVLTPDIVIVELQLPEHNGIEFLHEFCSHTDWRYAQVIVHSLLSDRQLQKHSAAWRQFNITEIHSKTSTSLEQLKNIVQKVATI